jgi:hypothetical protein
MLLGWTVSAGGHPAADQWNEMSIAMERRLFATVAGRGHEKAEHGEGERLGLAGVSGGAKGQRWLACLSVDGVLRGGSVMEEACREDEKNGWMMLIRGLRAVNGEASVPERLACAVEATNPGPEAFAVPHSLPGRRPGAICRKLSG